MKSEVDGHSTRLHLLDMRQSTMACLRTASKVNRIMDRAWKTTNNKRTIKKHVESKYSNSWRRLRCKNEICNNLKVIKTVLWAWIRLLWEFWLSVQLGPGYRNSKVRTLAQVTFETENSWMRLYVQFGLHILNVRRALLRGLSRYLCARIYARCDHYGSVGAVLNPAWCFGIKIPENTRRPLPDPQIFHRLRICR